MTQPQHSNTPQHDQAPAGMNPARRRLVKGAVATPLIVTIAGRPAWGSSCTPSALASANLSGRHDFSLCQGRSPGYWKNHDWPNEALKSADFQQLFGGAYYSGMTLGDVLSNPGSLAKSGGPSNVGFHAVAAYLNAIAFGELYPYTAPQVVTMYMNYHSSDPQGLAATFEASYLSDKTFP